MKKILDRKQVEVSPDVVIGGEKFVLISGPCAIESAEICLETASFLKDLSIKLGISYIFKSSYDKANRTAGSSFRSIGFEESLRILSRVRNEIGVPVLTDIHESYQAEIVAEVVDLLQIPAFLCRQTDLLTAAGKTGKAINVKKGQFMAPEDMQHVVEKVTATGNPRVCLTERGTSFGYHNLVVDMRSLSVMRQYAPIIFDVTHSIQTPSGSGNTSGGQRQFAPILARAAAAAGVDGFFIETHPNPDKALSDGPNSIPLKNMKELLEMIIKVQTGSSSYFSKKWDF
jgi:2-dehydro-3-deoxyphosphooctonate aldolase (KDO 8-P synthase)